MTVMYTPQNGVFLPLNLKKNPNKTFSKGRVPHLVNGHLAANICCTPLGEDFSLVKMNLFHREAGFYLKKEAFPLRLTHLLVLKAMSKCSNIYHLLVLHTPWAHALA